MRRAAAAMLALAALSTGCDHYETPNQPFPDLGLKTLEGESISAASFQGKPWVISVWLPGCESCARQSPLLGALRERYEAKGIGFLAISLVPDRDVTRDAAKQMGISLPVAVASREVLSPLSVNATPSTIFLSKDGRIVAAASGSRTRRPRASTAAGSRSPIRASPGSGRAP